MKVSEFYKHVEGSKNLIKDFEQDVEIQLYSPMGIYLGTSTLELKEACYKFSPWYNDGKGNLVLEIQVK